MQSLRHTVDDDHQELNLEKVFSNTSKMTDGIDAPEESSDTVGSPPARRITRSTSSAELMQKTNDLMESQARISSFISQLKGGEVTTHRASGFRVRRLTYAQKTAEQPEKPQPLTSTRTTIYASKEIGVTQEKKPPFPPSILGTFSCHGIEPAQDAPSSTPIDEEDEDDEEDDFRGIHQKTNQDRGCVVYPYNSSLEEGLFMVLDGHGEQGDRVSEFAMRNVRMHLTAGYSGLVCVALCVTILSSLTPPPLPLWTDCASIGKEPEGGPRGGRGGTLQGIHTCQHSTHDDAHQVHDIRLHLCDYVHAREHLLDCQLW